MALMTAKMNKANLCSLKRTSNATRSLQNVWVAFEALTTSKRNKNRQSKLHNLLIAAAFAWPKQPSAARQVSTNTITSKTRYTIASPVLTLH